MNFFFFKKKKGENAFKTAEETRSALGKEVVSVRMFQRWFAKFRSGNFSVQDLPGSGRPTEI